MKRLKNCENSEVTFAVLQCDCGYRMGIDNDFLMSVGDFTLRCPACDIEINTETDLPETPADIEKLLEDERKRNEKCP